MSSFDDASTPTPTPALSRFGVLLSFPGTASPREADTDRDEEADSSSASGALDWAVLGESLRDLVLCMRPSEWRYATKLSMLDPCDVLLGLLVRAIAACRSTLRPVVLLRCQVGDLAPVDAAVVLRRERESRADGAASAGGTITAFPAR